MHGGPSSDTPRPEGNLAPGPQLSLRKKLAPVKPILCPGLLLGIFLAGSPRHGPQTFGKVLECLILALEPWTYHGGVGEFVFVGSLSVAYSPSVYFSRVLIRARTRKIVILVFAGGGAPGDWCTRPQTKIIVILIFAGGGAPVPQRTDARTRKIVILIFAGGGAHGTGAPARKQRSLSF